MNKKHLVTFLILSACLLISFLASFVLLKDRKLHPDSVVDFLEESFRVNIGKDAEVKVIYPGTSQDSVLAEYKATNIEDGLSRLTGTKSTDFQKLHPVLKDYLSDSEHQFQYYYVWFDSPAKKGLFSTANVDSRPHYIAVCKLPDGSFRIVLFGTMLSW